MGVQYCTQMASGAERRMALGRLERGDSFLQSRRVHNNRRR
jgi:hypothetical protein